MKISHGDSYKGRNRDGTQIKLTQAKAFTKKCGAILVDDSLLIQDMF